jgi:hypothetical protein
VNTGSWLSGLVEWPIELGGYPTDKDECVYERARAEAALARLRLAVEALTKINAIYPKCWDLVDGGLAVMGPKSVDAFEEAHEAVSEALSAIGEIPE